MITNVSDVLTLGRMFVASVKLWQMEGEEFSLIITHNPSVREFNMEVLELFKTELLVEEVIVES